MNPLESLRSGSDALAANWDKPGSREIAEKSNQLLDSSISPKRIPQNRVTVLSIEEAPATVVNSAQWPQVRTGRSGGNESAGPTGVPSLDYGAPKSGINPTENGVRLAISEACAYGGRSVIRPDLAPWAGIERTLDFFARHRTWRGLSPSPLIQRPRDPHRVSLKS